MHSKQSFKNTKKYVIRKIIFIFLGEGLLLVDLMEMFDPG